ncbi:MAG: hypothetical protein TREMPRED_004564 [Tremellales sp. Tagirdzhanova-0007]|nr:MAG: hypothetical protein TREMPRED_004564 [Tremellales sp. Tagirdzhanova-0007]
MAPVRYDLAVASWRNSDVISIVSASGSPIAYFPLDFIMKGGQPEWTYVILAIQQITDQAIGTQWGLQDTDGQVVSAEAIPRAGKFIYGTQVSQALMRKTVFLIHPLPEVLNTSVAINPPLQEASNFRINVIARDGTCLLTDVPHNKCTAAHIAPYSRPDVYMQLLNITYDPPLFDASCGLLLRDELHHSFDRLEWSLYHKDGSFYVHCFTLSQSEIATLHGKKISPDRFRGLEESRPDRRLVDWHYKQCLMAHIRGFSANMD